MTTTGAPPPAAANEPPERSPFPGVGDGLPTLKDAGVLVVDDNRVNRHLLVALLERAGIGRITTANDGIEALEAVAVARPNLMLLDLMMPRLDGFEVCRRLRADPAFLDLPILVQSSLNRAEDRARAFAAGATDYVSKPINATELLARVRIHLQNQMLLNRLQDFRHRTEVALALARKMQEQLLPPTGLQERLSVELGLELATHFAPSSELGGDLWDLRQDAQGRLVVWLVDFSGHGVGSALNTFRLHAILRKLDFSAFDPAAFLATVNRRLKGLLPAGQFATMLAGVIDPAQDLFVYASAGATKPMVWTPEQPEPVLGNSDGLPLGIITEITYENRSLPLPPGASVFLYSDAAIELPVGAGVLDEPGLAALVRVCLEDQPAPPVFLPRLLAALGARGSFDDDLTALVIRRRR